MQLILLFDTNIFVNKEMVLTSRVQLN